jgi:orotidine-5'-phosphate decarboxylase
MAAGADYLVVGRPIRDARNPAEAFASIVAEVESALAAT